MRAQLERGPLSHTARSRGGVRALVAAASHRGETLGGRTRPLCSVAKVGFGDFLGCWPDLGDGCDVLSLDVAAPPWGTLRRSPTPELLSATGADKNGGAVVEACVPGDSWPLRVLELVFSSVRSYSLRRCARLRFGGRSRGKRRASGLAWTARVGEGASESCGYSCERETQHCGNCPQIGFLRRLALGNCAPGRMRLSRRRHLACRLVWTCVAGITCPSLALPRTWVWATQTSSCSTRSCRSRGAAPCPGIESFRLRRSARS